MSTLIRFATLLLCINLIACGGDSTPSAPDTNVDVNWQPVANAGWETSTAAAEAIDATRLQQAFNAAADLTPLYALLVVRNGKLVGEAYYHNQQRDNLQHLRSVTKTITMLMLGKAIEQGFIQSVNQPLSDFFATEYQNLLTDKGDITLAHLLDMSSGISWDESTAQGYNDWVQAADPVAYVLQRSVSSTPGSALNYNSGTSHLLSYIISSATGLTLEQYTRQQLFTPLGISRYEWETLPNNLTNGAAGLTLSARDLAKVGLLLQQQGLWQGQQLITASWIMQSATVSQPFNDSLGGLTLRGYGRQWWLGQTSQAHFQLAWGYGGQFVMTLPEQNLTLVLYQNFRNAQAGQSDRAMQLIRQHILPAVQ